jgi:hypothetical protein
MKRALLFTALFLAAGCRTIPCATATQAHHFREFNLIAAPTAADRAAVATLPAEVLEAVRAYWQVGPYYAGCNRKLPTDYNPILAARAHGRYILLDTQGCAIDSNRHLVYSLDRKCIVGGFAWYVQG